MVCFQNVSLTYWYSLINERTNKPTLLWFAFKMYLWLIDIHLSICVRAGLPVVVCFQNVSLTYWYSLSKWLYQPHLGCGLLSKCIFDLLIFTNIPHHLKPNLVVVCFQNVSLTYWYSLTNFRIHNKKKLWFAFKMYLWLIDIHSQISEVSFERSCGLLSKCIFDLLIFTCLKM